MTWKKGDEGEEAKLNNLTPLCECLGQTLITSKVVQPAGYCWVGVWGRDTPAFRKRLNVLHVTSGDTLIWSGGIALLPFA